MITKMCIWIDYNHFCTKQSPINTFIKEEPITNILTKDELSEYLGTFLYNIDNKGTSGIICYAEQDKDINTTIHVLKDSK